MIQKIIDTLHASAGLFTEDELSSLKNKLLKSYWEVCYRELEKQHTITCNLIDKEFKSIIENKKTK